MTGTETSIRVALALCSLGFAAALGACGDDTGSSGDDDPIDDPFPPPEAGAQFRTGELPLGPTEEKTICVIADLSIDAEIPVVKLESHNAGYTHHYILFKASEPMAAVVSECPDGLFTQHPPIYPGTRDQGPFEMPQGVAIPVKQHQTMILQVHLLNATDEPVVEELRINLHAGPGAVADYQKAGVVGGSDFDFEIPANMMHTETQRCYVPSAMNLFALTSHSHARTLAFDVKGKMGDVYHNDSWSEPNVEQYAPALALANYDWLEFSCTWFNETAAPIKYGETANDEMCMMFGYYYPAAGDVTPCLGL
ncbi:MAG: hypothetical protein AB7R00_28120 [Kofleriaceae bacterium]